MRSDRIHRPDLSDAFSQLTGAVLTKKAHHDEQSGHVQRSIAPMHRMMPASLFVREVLVTMARPRALVLKLTIPLVLTIPLLLGHAPILGRDAPHSAVCDDRRCRVGDQHCTRRESGLLARLAVTPRSPGLSMMSWVAGSTLIDAIQLVPALIAIFALAPVTAPAALTLVLTLIGVLFMANVLGSVVSSVGGGAGEVLIDVVVLLAPLLFFGGLFTGAAGRLALDSCAGGSLLLSRLRVHWRSRWCRRLRCKNRGLAACVTAVVSALVIVGLGRIVLRRR